MRVLFRSSYSPLKVLCELADMLAELGRDKVIHIVRLKLARLGMRLKGHWLGMDWKLGVLTDRKSWLIRCFNKCVRRVWWLVCSLNTKILKESDLIQRFGICANFLSLLKSIKFGYDWQQDFIAAIEMAKLKLLVSTQLLFLISSVQENSKTLDN